ncbi:hypothetical protein D7O18_20505 [Salmonella enterica subsp. enterica serovar Muenchen]|nr:hypothetical protein [Salmonella enterica subsp. enterica serovar Muenchen]
MSEFKEIKVSQTVKDELYKLANRIHEICQTSNIPFVLSFIDERRDAGDDVINNKFTAAYANYDSGVWDSSLVAAAYLIRIDGVPEWLIDLFIDAVEQQNNSIESNIIH